MIEDGEQLGSSESVPASTSWKLDLAGQPKASATFGAESQEWQDVVARAREQLTVRFATVEVSADDDSGNSGPTPMMITATPNTNTVYLYAAWNSNPILLPGTVNTSTGAVTLKPYSIVYQKSGAFPGPSAPAGSGSFPDLAGGAAATLPKADGSTTITPIGRNGNVDRLRASYPSVTGTVPREILRVMEIDVDVSTSTPTVSTSAIGTILATGAGSVTGAAMIDSPFGSDGVLIYWKETAASTDPFGPVIERAVVARDRTLSAPFVLSRASTGDVRSWNRWNFTGDYIKGASFSIAGQQPHFVTHWIETPSGADASIHANVVSTIEP